MSTALKSVRIIAQQKSAAHPTVNVSTAAHPQKQWQQFTQVGAAAPKNEYKTFQAGATGPATANNGLPTIYVPAYTGPA